MINVECEMVLHVGVPMLVLTQNIIQCSSAVNVVIMEVRGDDNRL